MTFVYCGRADAVQGLRLLHETGYQVTKDSLKKLEGIAFPEFYKNVALVMQDNETTL